MLVSGDRWMWWDCFEMESLMVKVGGLGVRGRSGKLVMRRGRGLVKGLVFRYDGDLLLLLVLLL